MKFYKKLGWAAVGGAVAAGIVSAWPAMTSHTVELIDAMTGPKIVHIPATGPAPFQKARFFSAATPAPLIVDLHYWSADQRGYSGDDARLDTLVAERGWNFIRPALAGPNNTPEACCSDGVIAAVNSAIAYAKAHGPVTEVYIVGGSGGGYTTLCAAMSQKVAARAFYAWAPITDLVAWHAEHAGDKYGRDVLQCTASRGAAINVDEARRRSPMYMPLPDTLPNLHIYAGIQDGSGPRGTVPPAHSTRFFNRIAASQHQSPISFETVETMVVDRRGPDSSAGALVGDRAVHLHRQAGPVDLVIFEGGHEVLARPTVESIVQDQSLLHSKRTKLAAR